MDSRRCYIFFVAYNRVNFFSLYYTNTVDLLRQFSALSDSYSYFQHDSEFGGLVQGHSSHHQSSDTALSGDPAQHYVGENHQYQLEHDLVLPNDYAHIHSDLDFLRFPFVNQEYFTDLEATNEIYSHQPVLSEEITPSHLPNSVSSGNNHTNVLGSVLHFYNQQ